MNTRVIDVEVARKVLTTVDVGLCKGLGKPTPGYMCVEAAVCYALGLPHSDEPDCVALSLRRLKIRLNDSEWSSNAARAKGLRRLALAQLGSAGVLDEREFAKRVARLAIQSCVPTALRAAASVQKNGERKERLLHWADVCEREPTEANAREAHAAAYAAYACAAAYAAYAAYAYAAADAAACAAAYAAADAAACAAYAAYAYAAADAAACAAARSAARDSVLAAFAEGVVQILIEMKAPGCTWLWLTEGGEPPSESSTRGAAVPYGFGMGR